MALNAFAADLTWVDDVLNIVNLYSITFRMSNWRGGVPLYLSYFKGGVYEG